MWAGVGRLYSEGEVISDALDSVKGGDSEVVDDVVKDIGWCLEAV